MKRKRVNKTPIDRGRIRRVPSSGFSWIDRRFVREGFLENLPREAALLYFFLVAVSDAEGVSFYADPTIMRILKLSPVELTHARFYLRKADLILYRYPFYQVLSLPPSRPSLGTETARTTQTRSSPRDGEPMSLQKFLALIAEGSASKKEES